MSEAGAAQPEFAVSRVETLFAWFHRIVAVYCMVFGIFYWVRLIGYYDVPLWRFDLMPVHWQIAATLLSVFFPFAAAGLWMLASWGPVIWFICAAAEIVMFVGLPQLFGRHDLIVASHLFAAGLYVAFRVVLHIQERRAARES
ncbi:MAG: hypothetical protein KF914_16430 [Rhizobiaceae bacterium]|nr:hypothetical protein [Rhizobiaceae bacterium]